MNEIRQLVENYYDIQKIRVETFNRIVTFIKENDKKIIEALSQKANETQIIDVSQYQNELPIHLANQKSNETQFKGVSQRPNEPHGKNVSHYNSETQSSGASREYGETHSLFALKLLKEKKYSEFVKKYIISHFEDETRFPNVSHKQNETQMLNALSPFLKQIENLIWFHNKLYETEKELYKRLDAWSRNHPLRTEYLNYVKGIGAVLASGIIAWLEEPIKKANHVSQIWSYCGLAPNQVRKRGEKVNYNPKLKTFAWKIGESFIKFKCFGRKLYDSFKEQAKQKHPDWSKGHIHNYAKRKVIKLFIASVWETWRKMNNLPVTKPYPIDFLGHKDIITPEMWMEKRSD